MNKLLSANMIILLFFDYHICIRLGYCKQENNWYYQFIY